MTSLHRSLLLCLGLSVGAIGCGDGTTGGAVDSGNGGTDTGVVRDTGPAGDTGPTVDTGPLADTGTTGDDSGTTGDDSGTTGDDSGTTDVDSAVSCAGIECTGYAAVLEASPRDADSLANCVIQLHQSDCCGATAAYGINHGARTALCAAEDTCTASYPDPICSDDTITTDSGESTTVMGNVRLRIVDGTCETFVCTSDPCRSAPGIAGGCG